MEIVEKINTILTESIVRNSPLKSLKGVKYNKPNNKFFHGSTRVHTYSDNQVYIEHAGNMGSRMKDVTNNFNAIGLGRWEEFDVIEDKGSPDYLYQALLKRKKE
jgi:hypothetical protein